ncbi:cysteine-rich small domain-containing protein [Alkaliphilus oremlandii]|uniref:Cysteine-rich small domain n=1 Tax=Alkaliphilus oremlandii (strain OhILAs) TaxID=350688 RepID=A8MIV8_ALKOO|nr:cysteine-rich small domain-containing protein [Alkaliphilus oremlandii]ABW19740.1 cysteine-rich small domain [Alkaliphilus oremlandii OhILAs]
MEKKITTENYKFNQNTACEFFPCHKVSDSTKFNCLFCYCPLYMLKDQCGGGFTYTDGGIKNCTNCTLPHGEGGYDHVMSKMKEVIAIGSERK